MNWIILLTLQLHRGSVICLGLALNENDERRGPSPDMLQKAVRSGIPVVAGAGNDNAWVQNEAALCGLPGVLCIGGINNGYRKSLQSSFGRAVDIVAPNEAISVAKGSFIQGLRTGSSYAMPQIAEISQSSLGLKTSKATPCKLCSGCGRTLS